MISKSLRGTAVYTALLVVTLVTAISVIWYTQTRLLFRQTQQMLNTEQTYLYSQKILDWSISQLTRSNAVPQVFLELIANQGSLSGRLVKYNSLLDKATNQDLFYLLFSEVIYEKQHLVFYTLLERIPNENQTQVNVIWQSR